MKRALLIVCLAALASGCASLKGGHLPNAADIKAAADKLSATKKEADEAIKSCPKEDGSIPVEEENEIGGAIMVTLTQQNGTFLVDGPLPEITIKRSDKFPWKPSPKNDVNTYVSKVGKLLASYSSRPELQWTFGVIENDGVNAFSAPGGYVAITTGLMRLMENEAQLAGILGHEIGHVVNKDVIKTYAGVKHNICVPAVTAEVYIRAGLNDVLPAAVMAQADFAKEFKPGPDGKPHRYDPKSGGFINALTDGVLSLRKMFGAGKEAEYHADKTAFELMLFAGYDTNEFDAVLRKAEQGQKSFSNHPSNVDRMKYLTKLRGPPNTPPKEDEPDTGAYEMFAAAGVKPEIPPEIKAAIPPEAPKK